MSLLEDIAERLHAVDPSDGKSQWADARLVPKTFTAYLNMAVEVVRLMEWAKLVGVKTGLVAQSLRGGLVAESPSGKEEIYRVAHRDPLTLPPEDWKP